MLSRRRIQLYMYEADDDDDDENENNSDGEEDIADETRLDDVMQTGGSDKENIN